MSRRALDVHDDRPHEHGGEIGWREELTFTFADPAICGVVRASWDPLERTATTDMAVRLEDGVVARATVRDRELRSREERVGGFTFGCSARMEAWTIEVSLTGLLLASIAAGTHVGRSVPVRASLEFRSTGPADGFASRRRVVTEQRFASIISSGLFAQPVVATGEMRIGPRRLRIDAAGVRTRSWGVREADPSDARLLVGFDASHAAWFERQILGDDTVVVAGSAGAIKVPERIDVTRDQRGRPTRLVVGGLAADVVGELPSEGGSEGLFVRCRSGDLEALGFAELAAQDAPEPVAAAPARVASEGDEETPGPDAG